MAPGLLQAQEATRTGKPSRGPSTQRPSRPSATRDSDRSNLVLNSATSVALSIPAPFAGGCLLLKVKPNQLRQHDDGGVVVLMLRYPTLALGVRRVNPPSVSDSWPLKNADANGEPKALPHGLKDGLCESGGHSRQGTSRGEGRSIPANLYERSSLPNGQGEPPS